MYMEGINEDLQLYERVPDMNMKNNSQYNPSRYVSIQDRVNSDPNYEKKYIEELISEGWYTLNDINDLFLEEMKGRHFKYRLNGTGMSGVSKGIFRSGGIIIGKNKENNNYILYKAYNGCIFPLQISDIQEIYVKDPNSKISGSKKEKVIKGNVYFKHPDVSTKFPVFLEDKNGKNHVVYYAKDNYYRDRFMMTKKFEYAYKTKNWEFE